MPTEVLLVRDGAKLVAANQVSADEIARLTHGQQYVAIIKRPRNPKHLRLVWVMMAVLRDGQTAYPTPESLMDTLKIATGLFETGKTVDGIPFVKLGSIAFASMDQATFSAWWDKAMDVIVTKIMPGITRPDLQARIDEIMAGPRLS